ncbi:hypothetical protein [Bradyrhizobium ottawaense]|uniref:hypothetical protein n=1 Tax=Bradyrhizobium ottawaense TaxID=931866 RepID=UPI00103877B4|nr:hypothetical protein [Bradyrhizobium ottawaense]
MSVRDRMSSHEPPCQTTFINLSEPAPQLMIILPNGYVVSYETIRAMDPENSAAWFDNMMNSDPDNIEPRASDQGEAQSRGAVGQPVR